MSRPSKKELLRRSRISRALRVRAAKESLRRTRISLGLRKYYRSVKTIERRILKGNSLPGLTLRKSAREIRDRSIREGVSRREAYAVLAREFKAVEEVSPGKVLSPPPPPVTPAPQPGKIILEGDISWTGLFAFLPGESSSVLPKSGPELESGMLNITTLSWDAAGIQLDAAFDRTALKDVRGTLDGSLGIETDTEASYNVWRVYDLFHYTVTDPGSGNLVLSVIDGPMMADWDTIAGEYK